MELGVQSLDDKVLAAAERGHTAEQVANAVTLLKKYGLAAAMAAIGPGVALCVFIHKCYWYVVDVFVGIDEKHGFDPRFIIFTALIVLAFVIGEVAIYVRKTKAA